MRKWTAVAALTCAALVSVVFGQGALGPRLEAKPTVTTAIAGVVAAGEPVALIHDNLKGSDGIVGMPDGTMAFIEQNTPKILRINLDDSLSTLVEDAAGTRALGVDSKGRLIGLVLSTPAHKADHVAYLYPPASAGIIATQVEGKPFNQANDFVVTKKDGIYMTDAGTLFKEPLSEPTWLYYIPPGGTPRRVGGQIVMPNGIALSPDDKVLYVNDSRGEYMIAYDIQPDGSLTNRRNFAHYQIEPESLKTFAYQADGLTVDNDGRVYACMPLSIQVFNPKGEFLGKIPLTKKMQNIAFGGADRRNLYMVSQGSVWKLRTLSRGVKGRAK